jgi:Imidazolonepropionase and related amidohydrolases
LQQILTLGKLSYPNQCHLSYHWLVFYMNMDIMNAIKASTFTAARSMMLEEEIGSIEKEKYADIIIWNINRVEQIPYMVTDQPIQCVYKKGMPAFIA